MKLSNILPLNRDKCNVADDVFAMLMPLETVKTCVILLSLPSQSEFMIKIETFALYCRNCARPYKYCLQQQDRL